MKKILVRILIVVSLLGLASNIIFIFSEPSPKVGIIGTIAWGGILYLAKRIEKKLS